MPFERTYPIIYGFNLIILSANFGRSVATTIQDVRRMFGIQFVRHIILLPAEKEAYICVFGLGAKKKLGHQIYNSLSKIVYFNG